MYNKQSKQMQAKESFLHFQNPVDGPVGLVDRFSTTLNNSAAVHNVAAIRPALISLPNLFDNFNSTSQKNTKLAFQTTFGTTTVSHTFTLPNGYYTPTTLLPIISAQINAQMAAQAQALLGNNPYPVGGAVTVTQDPTTGKISFALGNQAPTASLTLQLSSLVQALGLTGQLVIAPGTSEVLPLPPNFSGPTSVLLHCTSHGDDNFVGTDGKAKNVFAVVPLVHTNYGAYAIFNPADPEHWQIEYPTPRDLHDWDVQMTDEFYNPIFLPSNVSINVFMRCVHLRRM